jgi:hypothetical protein
MSLPLKLKKTGQLFQAHWGADRRDAYEFLSGESYLGDLYDVHRVQESDDLMEFVYTRIELGMVFEADELEEFSVGRIRLHPRLSKA